VRVGSLSRPILAVMSALVAALSLAGCVSMPSAGPVQSVPITQGPDAQGEPYQQVVIAPPGAGWKPTEIVQGFLAASASFGDNWQVAREYMTSQASKAWNPSWSAIVYSNGPNVKAPAYKAIAPVKPAATAKKGKIQPGHKARPGANLQASVMITGSVLANLSGSSLVGYGSYAVPSTSAPQGSPGAEPTIELVQVAGEWRISSAPSELLLTSDSFKSNYQLRNLYFLDPTSRFLVPDPVYVPLQGPSADLMNGLVYDLVHPPKDWLSGGATRTAFPVGTTFPGGTASIGDVTIDGVTAVVDLGGAIAKASKQVMQQISAQLVSTLSGSGQSGQAVQSVEVEVNGKPWIPPGGQGNPIQRDSKLYNPAGATATSKTFYYLDGAGNVMSSDGIHATPVRLLRGSAKYSQVAVSPDGKYLAVISKTGDLFIGPVGGALTKRGGSAYSTMSWDPNDDLWATMNEQLVMLRSTASQGEPIAVNVLGSAGNGSPVPLPFTAVKVAPDGVRVALVIGGNELDFGAISWQPGLNPAKPTLQRLQIVLSPFNVPPSLGTTFSSVAWYGPDDVITLTGPTPAVTEYPVNGDAATSISAIAGMRSIAASAGNALIAGLAKGQMVGNTTLTGSWVPIVGGLSPAYPG
jgi:hypothetical protein